MEELAYVATKIVKGFAGLAYVLGDSVVALGGPDAANRKPRPDEDEADGKR
ncbi:hypothetical protein AB0B78_24055 [Streptomyces sp. NPDC040724]|uniref:hypothetical protein n=1 Tax=unclassified Streptomyces TaxID=2593676 RepID=UPI0033DEBE69